MPRRDRSFPSAPEAERAMLGSILLNPLLIEEAKRDCPVDALCVPSNRTIFAAMLAIYERRESLDSILLVEELEGAFDSPGTVVSSLIEGVFVPRSLRDYVGRIRETARQRWLIKLFAMLEEKSYEDSSEDVVSYALHNLDSLRSGDISRRRPASLEEIADDQLLRHELFLKGMSEALPTGFREIDDRLFGGGLIPSAFYVIAAPTSMGKTTLGLDISANVGGTGHRAYIVSREMSRESLFDRLIAAEANVSHWKLRPGIWEGDYRKVQAAIVRLSNKSVILDDVSHTVSSIRGYLREYESRDQRVALLVVDYLQLLDAEGKRRETRNQEVGSLSRSLKGLAMEFRIPVIAISQLKRIGGREPELDDLRDSGEIEQDADTVLFLFGDRMEEGVRLYDRTLKCAKQREGPLFRFPMPFDSELVTYRRAEHLTGVEQLERDGVACAAEQSNDFS